MSRIHKDFSFLAANYLESRYSVNQYEVVISMDIITESHQDQNIANGRLNYLFYELLEGCVFIDERDTKTIEKFVDLGITVCSLPEDAWDQVIGVVLFKKINAVLEGRIIVTDLVIGSRMSGGVKFDMCAEELQELCNEKKWYNEPFPNLNDIHRKDSTKVVSLFKDNWSKIDLNWKENIAN